MFTLKLWFFRGLEKYQAGFESAEPHVEAGQGWTETDIDVWLGVEDLAELRVTQCNFHRCL